MPAPKNARTDNPFTEHDEEERPNPTREEAIQTVENREEPEKEKVVSVDPPERDEDDERGPTPRQQKRRERYDAIQREKDAAEERARQAEQLVAALRAQQMTAPQQQRTDPFEEEEKKLKEDWTKHLALADTLARGSTPEQRSQWQNDHWEIQSRQQKIAARRAMAEAGIVPGQRVDHEQEAIKAHIRANFPEIAAANPDGSPRNPQALMYADGIMRAKLARERRMAPTMKDYEEALEQTRRDLRLPGAVSPAPSQEIRRKFSGGGLGGANGSANGSREIRMTDAEQKMAEAMYKVERDPKTGKTRRLKPEESHAKWAQTVGKKILEERRTG